MQEANGLTKDTDIKQEKILKLKLAFDTEESAYRILNEHLLGNENILELRTRFMQWERQLD